MFAVRDGVVMVGGWSLKRQPLSVKSIKWPDWARRNMEEGTGERRDMNKSRP